MSLAMISMMSASVEVLIVLQLFVAEAGTAAHRDEWACLDDAKLKPDSAKFVANLGQRNEDDSQQFWVRYETIDEQGRETALNVKCVKRLEGWRRDAWGERVSIFNYLEKRSATDAKFARREFKERLEQSREAVLSGDGPLKHLDTNRAVVQRGPVERTSGPVSIKKVELAGPYDVEVATSVITRHRNEVL